MIPISLNDFDFSNKPNHNTKDDLIYKRSDKNLMKALKSILIDELMLHIQVYVRKN